MNKTRFEYLDDLKGLAILIVVASHVMTLLLPRKDANEVILNYIGLLQMPLFVFVSGFVASLSRKILVVQFLKKKILRLLVPFFVWSYIAVFMNDGLNIIQIIKTPSMGLWFLWAIFFIVLVHYLLVILSEKIRIYIFILGIMCSFALFLLNYICDGLFGLKEISFYYLFYLVGWLSGNKRDKYLNKSYGNHFIMLILFLLFIVLGYFCKKQNVEFVLQKGIIGLIAYFMNSLISLSACFLFLLSSYKLECKTYVTFLRYLGKASLGIYVVHFYVIYLFRAYWISTSYYYLDLLLYVCAVVIVSYCVVRFLMLSRITSTLLLGENNKTFILQNKK